MGDSLTHKAVHGSAWSIVDVLLRQGIGFVISIVLARLLDPAAYGTIGVLMVFVVLSNVFVDSGFSAGLIRKTDKTPDDLSTAFWFNIAMGLLAYAVVFACAPLVASFFEDPSLCVLLRVLGLMIVFNSCNLVQNAILISSLRVKQIALITCISQVLTGAVAIFFAYKGYGVWALVGQQLCSSFLQMVLLILTTKWHPSFVFNRASFRYLWGFGSKLLLTNLIGNLFAQAYSFIIGKVLGKPELGLYNRSDHFAQQSVNVASNVINKSIVPYFAQCQKDPARLQENYLKVLNLLAFVAFPLMFMLAFCARPVFLILFGSKWEAAIPLFTILCLGYPFEIFSNLALQLIQVTGRSDWSLRLEFIKKPVYAAIIVATVFLGLKVIIIGKSVYMLVAMLINFAVASHLLGLSYLKGLRELLKYAGLVLVVMFPLHFAISAISTNIWLQIVAFPLLSAAAYLGLCCILKLPVLILAKKAFAELFRYKNLLSCKNFNS